MGRALQLRVRAPEAGSPGLARTIANVCLGRFRLQIAECRLLTSGEAGLRETPLNPVSQERLQAKKQDLFLLRRRLHKSEGGWNPARNLPGLGAFNPAPPAPRGQGQLQPLEKQRHLVATTAPAALADGAGRHNFFFFFFFRRNFFASYHCPVEARRKMLHGGGVA